MPFWIPGLAFWSVRGAFWNSGTTRAPKRAPKANQKMLRNQPRGRPRFYGRQAALAAAADLRCKQLRRVAVCFVRSVLCGLGCFERAPSACSWWLADPCARLVLGLGTSTHGLCQCPQHSVVLTPRRLFERSSEDKLGQSHGIPHVRRTTAQWACDLVHGTAQAVLGRSTRRHPRSAHVPLAELLQKTHVLIAEKTVPLARKSAWEVTPPGGMGSRATACENLAKA